MKVPSEEIHSKSMIFYFLLMLNSTMAVLLTVCEIFLQIEVENRDFRPLYSDFIPPSGGMPSIST